MTRNEDVVGNTATSKLIVYIQDENDNSPAIVALRGTGQTPPGVGFIQQVGCDAPGGSYVARIEAVDPDEGLNGTLSYSLVSRGHEFEVDPLTGVITRTAHLGAEPARCATYRVTVEVRDHGVPPRVTTSDVILVLNASLAYVRAHQQHEEATPLALVAGLQGSTLIVVPVVVCAVFLVFLLVGAAALGVYCWRRRRASKRAKAHQQLQLSEQLLHQLPEQPQLLMEQLCRCKSMPTVEWERDKDMMIQIRCSNDWIYRPTVARVGEGVGVSARGPAIRSICAMGRRGEGRGVSRGYMGGWEGSHAFGVSRKF